MNPIFYLAYSLIQSNNFMFADELLEPYTNEILALSEILDYSFDTFGDCSLGLKLVASHEGEQL